MTRRFVRPLLAVGAIVFAGAAGAAASATAGAAVTCVALNVNGHRDCLVAGRACHARYEKLYEAKDFNCVRNSTGRYHLRAEIHPGPIRY